jgi:hypothetical protein
MKAASTVIPITTAAAGKVCKSGLVARALIRPEFRGREHSEHHT